MKKYFDAQKTTADENLLSGFGQKNYRFCDLEIRLYNILI